MDGIINIYKEKGYTSHDVVARLRGILKQKKIGHTGTLDPDAEGVLPVCLGKSTKVCGMLTEKDKVYETVLRLGITTDTQDMTGVVQENKPVDRISEAAIRQVIDGYVGSYEQIPPMYSALKVNGRKLYELAREGVTVERKSRPVTIYAITILAIELPQVRMQVHCSKGTYIRTLCHDIGQDLGCGGCMEALTRTKVGCFELPHSLKLSEVEQLAHSGRLRDYMISSCDMFPELPLVTVRQQFQSIACNGNPLLPDQLTPAIAAEELTEAGGRIRVSDQEGHFIGIYQYDEQREQFQPVKMFLEGVK